MCKEKSPKELIDCNVVDIYIHTGDVPVEK